MKKTLKDCYVLHSFFSLSDEGGTTETYGDGPYDSFTRGTVVMDLKRITLPEEEKEMSASFGGTSTFPYHGEQAPEAGADVYIVLVTHSEGGSFSSYEGYKYVYGAYDTEEEAIQAAHVVETTENSCPSGSHRPSDCYFAHISDVEIATATIHPYGAGNEPRKHYG